MEMHQKLQWCLNNKSVLGLTLSVEEQLLNLVILDEDYQSVVEMLK